MTKVVIAALAVSGVLAGYAAFGLFVRWWLG